MGFQALWERNPLPGGRRFRIIAAAALVILAVIAGVVLLDVLDEADVVARQQLCGQAVRLPRLGAAGGRRRGRRRLPCHRALADPHPVGVLPLLVMVEAVALAEPFLPRVPKSRFYTDTPSHEFLADHIGSDPTASGPHHVARHQHVVPAPGGHGAPDHQPTWADLLREVNPNAFMASPTFSTLASTEHVPRRCSTAWPPNGWSPTRPWTLPDAARRSASRPA